MSTRTVAVLATIAVFFELLCGSVRSCSAGVASWSPGNFHSEVSWYESGGYGDDAYLSLDPVIGSLEETVVLQDSLGIAWNDWAPVAYGSANTRYKVTLSAAGVDAIFWSGASAFASYECPCYVTASGTNSLTYYRFVLDSPTDVSLSVATDNPGELGWNDGGQVAANVYPYAGWTPLFSEPPFNAVPSGFFTETRELPAGDYRFGATSSASAIGQGGAGAHGVSTHVILSFATPTGVAEQPLGRIRATVVLTPNPSHGRSSLTYVMPYSGEVDVSLFSIDGRRVETLAHGVRPEGRTTMDWQCVRPLSGIFFVRMTGRDFVASCRVVMLR